MPRRGKCAGGFVGPQVEVAGSSSAPQGECGHTQVLNTFGHDGDGDVGVSEQEHDGSGSVVLRVRGMLAREGGGWPTEGVLRPRTPDNIIYLDTEVAEIKRANNLISEQDFYALRTLKIPVPRYGVMTEFLEEASRRKPCSTTSKWPLVNGPCHANDGSLMLEDTAVHMADKPGAFLVEVDRNLEAIVRSADSLSPKEEPRLTAHERGAVLQRQRRQKDTCDGADCGLRWWNAVAAMLLVGIATPLLYLLYHQLQIPFHVPTTTPGPLLTNTVIMPEGIRSEGHVTPVHHGALRPIRSVPDIPETANSA
uniref:lysM and putative peptidoglycan-binding domain-containing protein 4-like isoform X2 n=1 Tax=Myxine glutinosa TaxID=7769 RepID=UPI00358FAF99